MPRKAVQPFCSVEGCGAKHFGRGYCRRHYITLYYSPPKRKPRVPYSCAHCGTAFFAYHAAPKFCSMTCSAAYRAKPFIVKKGYKKVLRPDHQRADSKGYVFEHILVAEQMVGRPLAPKEEVHHKDFDRQNNSPDNLVVCADHAEHMRYHSMPS